MLDKEKVTLVPTYSTTLFPRIVTLDEGTYIIWDNHFWNIYEHYLCLFEMSQYPFIPKPRLLEKVVSLNSIALANLLDSHPSLSLSFALLYIEHGAKFGLYDNDFYSSELPSYLKIDLILSQVYVLIHELTHNRLNNNPAIRNSIANQLLFHYDLGKIPFVQTENDAKYEHVFRAFKEIQKTGNKKIIEEFTCDYIAALETMKIAHKVIRGSISEEKVVNTVVNAIAKINYFQSWLRQLQASWGGVYREWTKTCIEDFPQNYLNGLPAPTYLEADIRLGLLVPMINMQFTQQYGCSSFANVVQTDIFDIASQKMLNLNYVLKVLKTEVEHRKTPINIEARKERDRLLRWK